MIKSIRSELRIWNTRFLFRSAMILAILALSMVFGQEISLDLFQKIVLVVSGTLVLLLVIRQIEIGILLLVLASFAVRLEVATGTLIPLNASVLGSILILAIWLLGMIVVDREILLAPLKVNGIALAFIAATTVSLLVGNIPFFPLIEQRASLNAQLGGWSIYVLSIGLFLMVGHKIREEKWLRRLTWVFLLAGAVYLLFRLYPPLAPLRSKVFVHPQSFGSMFWTWLAALAFGQFLFNSNLSKEKRLMLAILVGLVFYINLTQSRDWLSGWVHPLIAVTVILWLRSWRWGMLLTVIGVVFVALYFTLLNNEIFNSIEQYSLNSRVATWPIMVQLIKASPFIGLGPSNYYFYTALYPILGWYVRFNSHNNYVDLIAQTGLIGLGLFLWLFFELVRLSWNLRQRVKDGFHQAYVAAAIGGLAALFVSGFMGDWFLPFLYNIGFRGFRFSIMAWIFLGGLVAMDQMLPQQVDKSNNPANETVYEAASR